MMQESANTLSFWDEADWPQASMKERAMTGRASWGRGAGSLCLKESRFWQGVVDIHWQREKQRLVVL
jgi:hypothetical protein